MNSTSLPLLPVHADSRYAEALYRLRHLLHEYDSSSQAGSDVAAQQQQQQQHRQWQEQQRLQQHQQRQQQLQRWQQREWQLQQQQQQSWQLQAPEPSRTPAGASQMTSVSFGATPTPSLPPRRQQRTQASLHEPTPSIQIHAPDLSPIVALPPGFEPAAQSPPPPARSPRRQRPGSPPQPGQQLETAVRQQVSPSRRSAAVSRASPIALPRQRQEATEAGTSTTELAALDGAKVRMMRGG